MLTLTGFTLNVASFQAVVYAGAGGISAPYIGHSQSHTRTVPAASAQPRRDICVVRVWDDDEDSTGQKKLDTEYVSGVPAASPSKPPLPSGSFELGVIDVPAVGGGNPTLTYTSPWVVATGGILPVRNPGELPTTLVYEGSYADVRSTKELRRWSGSAWQTVAQVPAGHDTYEPVVTGHGGATFSTRTGVWLRRNDGLVWFCAYLSVSASGSGSNTVTITAPTGIYRTVRQVVHGHLEGLASPGLRYCSAVSFTGGSGAVWDRIRMDTGTGSNSLTNLTGADLVSGTLVTVSGSYLEGPS
ncbi:hypothetical protein AB0C02_28170 [Micromonospora sp. NPDC048999]|uniref:hypothetical protein n=1 Tax=Micromonospora sp. NPDC048999 TaxID=3155391 RepID=UPI0033E0CDDD